MQPHRRRPFGGEGEGGCVHVDRAWPSIACSALSRTHLPDITDEQFASFNYQGAKCQDIAFAKQWMEPL